MTADRGEGRVAILAGVGRLPAEIVAALAARGEVPLVAAVAGFAPEGLSADVELRLERLVPFLDHLRRQGVARVVLAGAVSRPRLDPAAFDPATAALVPRMLAAMQAGDDRTLRELVALIEEAGFAVVGAADLVPCLCPAPGVLGSVPPSPADASDADRAAEIVAALGAVDIGQGAVVARGLCLAVETLPGTDAMLGFVAQVKAARPDAAALKGLLWKAAKPAQDRRVDLPAIGPGTVAAARAAGLAGIAFRAGEVMVLDRAATVAAADAAGLFLWAR
jgi:UDP-2,3-diacylglucosamine hydrolase